MSLQTKQCDNHVFFFLAAYLPLTLLCLLGKVDGIASHLKGRQLLQIQCSSYMERGVSEAGMGGEREGRETGETKFLHYTYTALI